MCTEESRSIIRKKLLGLFKKLVVTEKIFLKLQKYKCTAGEKSFEVFKQLKRFKTLKCFTKNTLIIEMIHVCKRSKNYKVSRIKSLQKLKRFRKSKCHEGQNASKVEKLQK